MHNETGPKLNNMIYRAAAAIRIYVPLESDWQKSQFQCIDNTPTFRMLEQAGALIKDVDWWAEPAVLSGCGTCGKPMMI